MERGPTRMCSPYSVLGTPFRSLLFAPFVRLEKRRHLGNNTAPTAICSACLDETCSRGRRQLDGAPGVGERPLLIDAAPDSWVPVLSHPQPQRYKERPALGAKSTEREKTESSFERLRGQSHFVRLGMVASNVVLKAGQGRADYSVIHAFADRCLPKSKKS
ncbi:hypothetical protein M431DRAFT_386758 [Trichoderma harzianum CBS 226.95]|uniref:Uncharacterized protein n=1 Tax=Trichoderma harzianum CBS 226.95 TaxID=983964 RepID=A0A2T4AID8_TRIHA|nr:hypothetical protein M431DRAFT_386758 [Trichoderma harzianum CBS 226.95]PTB56802.1 hypothetical protein M431DRAFT_386758 [Trichoderma harzianum CBS 226.95]